jgi:hypothetical protein
MPDRHHLKPVSNMLLTGEFQRQDKLSSRGSARTSFLFCIGLFFLTSCGEINVNDPEPPLDSTDLSLTSSSVAAGTAQVAVPTTTSSVTPAGLTQASTATTVFATPAPEITLPPQRSAVELPTQSKGDVVWNVTERPPTLENPRKIVIGPDSNTTLWPAYNVVCAGKVIWIQLKDGEDAEIRFVGDKPLPYPLIIQGGRHSRVIGLNIKLQTQPGCEAGKLPNVMPDGTVNNTNSVHPRVPNGIAVSFNQSGISFVEGAFIDLNGHEADCFVVRNPPKMTSLQARSQRDFVLQNSACHGVEGLGKSDVGDGLHGDLFQNQGEVLRRVVFENVTLRTSLEGIILHEWDGFKGAVELKVRRFNYGLDERFMTDDAYDHQLGTSLVGWADSYTFDQIYVDDKRPVGYLMINDQRYGDIAFHNILPMQGIFNGKSPGGEFAQESNLGSRYTSPHK